MGRRGDHTQPTSQHGTNFFSCDYMAHERGMYQLRFRLQGPSSKREGSFAAPRFPSFRISLFVSTSITTLLPNPFRANWRSDLCAVNPG